MPRAALKPILLTILATLLAMGCNPSNAQLRPESSLGQAIEQARLTSWRSLIEQSGALDEGSKLQAVNDFVNRTVSFVSDQQAWGQEDYWATPAQTIGRGVGDCEDFAVGKYFSLVEMGVASEKLRLTFVKALAANQAHMVLAYYPSPSAQPLILDNLDPRIRPASERRDLLPVYSFNDLGVFLAKTPQRASQPPQFLSRWSDVSERVLADEVRRQANQG